MLGMPFNRTSVQVLRPHHAHAVLVKYSQRRDLESSGLSAPESIETVNMQISCGDI